MNQFQLGLVVTALVVGAINTLGFTLQNRQTVIEYGIEKTFFHPYMQAFMVSASGLPAMLYYLWLKYKASNKALSSQEIQKKSSQKQKVQEKIHKPHVLFYLVLTALDIISAISFLVALNFISGSVYTNLRGGLVLTTFLFSYIFLKIAPTRARIVGCIFIMLGLVVVGVTNIQFATDSTASRSEILIGYGLIILGLISNSIQFICEEHLISKYKISPYFVVGINAVYGIVIFSILIPLLAITPCNFGPHSCVIDDQGNAVVENALVYFRQVGENGVILAAVIVTFITMAVYNILGVIITKEINSVARAICDVSRIVVVWTVGIVVTVTVGRIDKRYRLQSLNPWQLLGSGVGFIVLIIGNLIYYQVIKLKCGKPQQQNEEALIQGQPEPQ